MNIRDTIQLSRLAHDGQIDKAGRPYWEHPISVMNRLGSDATLEEKQVALLHDVLEDTDYTAKALLALGFSATVVEAVELLSRPDGLTYADYIRLIAASGNRIAIRVKIADNEDNSAPERIAALPEDRRGIVYKYERSLRILRPALESFP